MTVKLVLDNPKQKNAIGKAMTDLINGGFESVWIVSPYICKLEEIISLSKINNARIICYAESNNCNPYTLEKLHKKPGITIKSRVDIHAKVYIFTHATGDEVAFVTSANATANGLKDRDGTIEAAVEIRDQTSIAELKQWFETLDKEAIRVSNYSAKQWEKLKSAWNLRQHEKASWESGPLLAQKELPNLYDLVVTKRIPADIGFTFLVDEQDCLPDHNEVKQCATEHYEMELPESNDWDYWIEAEDMENGQEEHFRCLQDVLKEQYNHTMVAIKCDSPKRKAFFMPEADEVTFFNLLDRPVVYENQGKKLLLTLYRTDNIRPPFIIDKKFISLLTKSLKYNKQAWFNFNRTKAGRYGYCSVERLYTLVDSCIG